VFLNGAWRCALGHEPDACRGRLLREFVVEDDGDTVAAALRAKRISAPELRPVVRVRCVNGELSWMELSVAGIAGGGAVGGSARRGRFGAASGRGAPTRCRCWP